MVMPNDQGHERASVGFSRKCARRLLVACGIRRAPVELAPIVAHLGLEYREVELPENVSAYCCEYRGKRYAFVNQNEHAHRQRFSLAHEIGHLELFHNVRYVLTTPIDIDHPPALTLRSKNDPREREANIFAGEILVPLGMLKRECVGGIDLARLAETFVVSQDVVAIAVQTHWRSLQPKRKGR